MLFYKNYIIYHNIYCYYCGVFNEKYVCTKFHRNWWGCELHGHICRHCNVLPEAVYRCFTRTTLFTKLFTSFYDQSYRLLSCHQVSLLSTFWFLR